MALTPEKRKLIQQLLGSRLEELSLPSGLQNEGMATSATQAKGGGIEPSAFISEAGGTAGAITGGAIGTALFPGVGTVIGAGLGGLIGGFGGSAVEQQVRDKKVDVGKAAREGLIEGIFSAGPLKLAKLGKAGAKIATSQVTKNLAEKTTADILSEALESSTGKIGKSLTATARGVTAGEKLGGQRITPQTARSLNEFLTKEVKVRGAAPEAQLDDLSAFITKKSSELDDVLTKGNRTLTDKDSLSIVRDIGNKFKTKIAGPTEEQRKLAQTLAKQVDGRKSLLDLNDFVRNIDEQINFARASNAVEPLREQVLRLFRSELRDEIARRVPGAKGVKGALTKAYQSEELLLNAAARRGSGISPAGISLPARAGQAVTSRAGRKLEQVGGALESTSSRALGTRAALAGALNPDASAQQAQLQEGSQLSSEPAVDDIEALLASQESQGQSGGSVSEEDINAAILADIQETGGKNVEAIQMIAQLFGPKDEFAGLGAVEKRGVAAAETAQSIVDELEGQFQQSGGAKGRIGGTVSKATGALGLDSQTQAFRNIRGGFISRIVRALGEVGTLNEGDIQRAISLIPDVTATPEEAAIQFESLRQILEDSKQALLRTAKQ